MANGHTDATFETLASYLRDMGLGALFSIDHQGNPGGWLWEQMEQGFDSPDELLVRLEQTDVYRERFGVILQQKERAAAGEPVYVMSPAEVLAYERQVTQMMSRAGMPTWFYDEPADFHKLILADMSPQEVSERIDDAYEFVLSAPPEVRQTFEEYYGVNQGDAALAAFALDPERTLRDINKATRTAYVGGMAKRFDIQVDQGAARRIAELPLTQEGVTSGLRQVASQADIFDEGITETRDITANDGVAAQFEGDAEANRIMEQRVIERRSIDRSSTGGAAIGSQGVVGAGSA